MSNLYYCYYTSPLGQLLLAGTADTLHYVKFTHTGCAPKATWQLHSTVFTAVVTQLDEYFAGTRQTFTLKWTLHGSAFQQKVLNQVANIAYGQTAAYSDIAQLIAQPTAARAVGMANANNPLPIIIPCHRVIGKNGTLTGFAGGIAVKQRLLALESHMII